MTETTLIQAKVLWFNEAKGYGLIRSIDFPLDDIRIDAAVVEDQQHLLLEGTVIQVYIKETLTGFVVDSLNLPAAAAGQMTP